jgi:hypothetical protein
MVGPSGYADQDAGPPVEIAQWAGMVIMVDSPDAGLG